MFWIVELIPLLSLACLTFTISAEAPVIANPEEAERAMRQVQKLQAGGALDSWEEVPTIVGDIPTTGHSAKPYADSQDLSPPRRKGRHDSPDSSPPRNSKQNNSHAAKQRDDSPAFSPIGRTRHDSPDASPPRRQRRASPSPAPPPKRARHDSPDASPPRQQRQTGLDASPPRRRRQASPDASPPRRKRQGSQDSSPPRRSRHDSPDPSPPTKQGMLSKCINVLDVSTVYCSCLSAWYPHKQLFD